MNLLTALRLCHHALATRNDQKSSKGSFSKDCIGLHVQNDFKGRSYCKTIQKQILPPGHEGEQEVAWALQPAFLRVQASTNLPTLRYLHFTRTLKPLLLHFDWDYTFMYAASSCDWFSGPLVSSFGHFLTPQVSHVASVFTRVLVVLIDLNIRYVLVHRSCL